MEEKMNVIPEEMLDEVSGGAGAKKHVQIVNCKNCCNVRSTPNAKTEANKIGHANLGDRYVFYGWSGGWAKVRFGSKTGYIYKKFVKIV